LAEKKEYAIAKEDAVKAKKEALQVSELSNDEKKRFEVLIEKAQVILHFVFFYKRRYHIFNIFQLNPNQTKKTKVNV